MRGCLQRFVRLCRAPSVVRVRYELRTLVAPMAGRGPFNGASPVIIAVWTCWDLAKKKPFNAGTAAVGRTAWLWHGPGQKTQPEEMTLKMETNTDTTQEPARCQQPIVLPLFHDRDEFGDWGWIRDQTGAIVYEAKIPQGADLTEHRRNKTDPSQSRVDALLKAFEIVQRLAEWSAKYPRQQIHSFLAKVDEQLIEIEHAAKAWLDGQNVRAQAPVPGENLNQHETP